MSRKSFIPISKMNKKYLDLLYTLETATPYEVITMKCFDCCAYKPEQSNDFFLESKESVMECKSSCPLNKFLNGAEFGKKMTKIPKNKRNLTDEQRKAIGERLRQGRQNKNIQY